MPTAEEARNGASRRPHAAWRCYPPLKRGAHLAEAEAAKESAAMALAATASRGHGGLPLTVTAFHGGPVQKIRFSKSSELMS